MSAEDRHAAAQTKTHPRSLEPPSASSLPSLPGAPESQNQNDGQSATYPTTLVDHPSLSEHELLEDDESHDHHDVKDDEDEDEHVFGGHTALRFLLAGGVAGVISRTATAPFDRLKVYLITAAPEQLVGAASANGATEAVVNAVKSGGASAGVATVASGAQHGSKIVGRAVLSLYRGGGIRAFWVGNGLNTAKILPVRFFLLCRAQSMSSRSIWLRTYETNRWLDYLRLYPQESAIKFLSYETSVSAFRNLREIKA